MPIKMKVILTDTEWNHKWKLSLTQEQIDMIQWLIENSVGDMENCELEILSEADHWEEV